MSKVGAWIQASRLASQSYIFLPILMGQAIWVFQGGKIDLLAFILVQLFGLFDQLFIVYANDYADQVTDSINKTPTMFSGGSRVLVDGLLKPAQLRNASILMALLCLICGVAFAVLFGYYYMIMLISVGLILLWMYSYPPFRQSYRGGGELLQAIGTGLLLPVIGYYAQSGKIDGFLWNLLIVTLPTSLACAISTALPDQPSDNMSRKRLIPVLIGLTAAKNVIIILNVMSIVAFYFLSFHLKNDILNIIAISFPVASLIGMLVFVKGKPGESHLTSFVTLSVLVTLSLIGGLTLSFFRC